MKKKEVRKVDPAFKVLNDMYRLPEVIRKLKHEYPCAGGVAYCMEFFWYLAIGRDEVIVVKCFFKKAFCYHIGFNFEYRMLPYWDEMSELNWRAVAFFRERYGDRFPTSKRHPEVPDLSKLGDTKPVENCLGYTREFERLVKSLIWKFSSPLRNQIPYDEKVWVPEQNLAAGDALPWGEDREPSAVEVKELAEETAEVVLEEGEMEE